MRDLQFINAVSWPRAAWLGGLALLVALFAGCASRMTALSGITGGGAESSAADDPFPTASEAGLSTQASKDEKP